MIIANKKGVIIMKKSIAKKILSCALALVLTLGLTACGGDAPSDSSEPSSSGEQSSTPNAEPLKVTLVATATGLGDRSFNDMAWEGIQRAEAELGVEVSIIEPKSVSDFSSSIATAAASGADVILAFGGAFSDALAENAPKFPDVYFGGLNCTAESDNLQVAQTSDHEGSFLAGALAALMTETGTIGGIGGQDADNINRFYVGYEEGAKYINPDIEVLISYVGSYSDPAKGKDFALQLMNEGADIIYAVAGGTGEGLFEAVRENEDLYAIGVDADQDYITEGKILTSMMKRVDNIAYKMIEDAINGTFETGYVVYDLVNGGVALSPMTYTKDLIGEEIIAELEAIEEKIISGEIVVTDLFAK